MSLPRFFLDPSPAAENTLLPLDSEALRHLRALRLQPGDALELVLGDQPWKADLAELDRNRAVARLVAPLHEEREPPFALQACLPLPAQLSLFDEWLPPLVERWERIIISACEQSHRSRRPELRAPIAFADLLAWEAPQKWVAYELLTGQANPILRREPLAFTSGPEGGISDEEYATLAAAGWQPLSLGRSILRAVTAPVALLGAVQFGWGQAAPGDSGSGRS